MTPLARASLPIALALLLATLMLTAGCGDRSDRKQTNLTDSVRETGPGGGLLKPVAQLTHERIGECSGIVWCNGAFFVHNDSGDEPVLYRSLALDFANPEILSLPGADAIDWEDICLFDGDLVVGDIGNNRREREFLTLYRARYVAAAEGGHGELKLVAVYPFKYPDAPHDAEALAVIDGSLHIISKARDEAVTNVYVFESLRELSELGPGEFNQPRLISGLDIGTGEQITAADYEPESHMLVLLTYNHILRYPADQIYGKPTERTRIAARQCESLCFRGRQLVFTNEQRDVYTINDFIRRPFDALLPTLSRSKP